MKRLKTNYKEKEFYLKIGNLVQDYHDRLFINSSLSDLKVLLLCIFIADENNKSTGHTYIYIKSMFVTLGRNDVNFRVAMSGAKKKKFVDTKYSNKNKGDLIYLTIYGINEVRNILGESQKSNIYLIKSGQTFSAIKIFENFLEEELSSNEILLCDTYISERTLFPFTVLEGKLNKLRILTSNLCDKTKYNDYKNRLSLEFKLIVEEKENRKIHDRYIIGNQKCWSIGTSLKDFGNKDTIIKEVPEVYLSLKDLFNERWNE